MKMELLSNRNRRFVALLTALTLLLTPFMAGCGTNEQKKAGTLPNHTTTKRSADLSVATPTLAPDYKGILINNSDGQFNFVGNFKSGINEADKNDLITLTDFPGGLVLIQPQVGPEIFAKGEDGLRAMQVLTQSDVLEQVIGRSEEDPRLATFYTSLVSGGNANIIDSNALKIEECEVFQRNRYYIDTEKTQVSDDLGFIKTTYYSTVFDPSGQILFYYKYEAFPNSGSAHYDVHLVTDIQIFNRQSSIDWNKLVHETQPHLFGS